MFIFIKSLNHPPTHWDILGHFLSLCHSSAEGIQFHLLLCPGSVPISILWTALHRMFSCPSVLGSFQSKAQLSAGHSPAPLSWVTSCIWYISAQDIHLPLWPGSLPISGTALHKTFTYPSVLGHFPSKAQLYTGHSSAPVAWVTSHLRHSSLSTEIHPNWNHGLLKIFSSTTLFSKNPRKSMCWCWGQLLFCVVLFSFKI